MSPWRRGYPYLTNWGRVTSSACGGGVLTFYGCQIKVPAKTLETDHPLVDIESEDLSLKISWVLLAVHLEQLYMSLTAIEEEPISATAQWLHGLWEYYRGYTRSAIHAASAAALTAFGLLIFIDPLFVVLAIATYICPPVILYSIGADVGKPSDPSTEPTVRADSVTNPDIDSDSDSDSDDGDSDSDSNDGDTDSDGLDTDAHADR